MKKLLFLLAVLVIVGCSSSTKSEEEKAYVEFHLQNQFNGELVSLLWDHHTFYRESPVTNNVLSLADIAERDVNAGRHLLTVIVDEEEASENLTLESNDSVFVLIRYYPQDIGDIDAGIYIDVTEQRPYYD